MKKIGISLLVIIMLCAFTSCEIDSNTKSKKVIEVEEAIAEINLEEDNYISLDGKVNLIEMKYAELSNKNKAKVSNYHILEQARNKIDMCFKRDALIEAVEKIAAPGIKSSLRNPSSYQDSSVFYSLYEYNEKIYVSATISFSAQNGFGGYNRESVKKCYVYNDTFDNIDSYTYNIDYNKLEEISNVEYSSHWEKGTNRYPN